MSIQADRERGVYQKDIAETLGVHPRTIRRALARGHAPSGKRPGARRSLLDPWKPLIDRLIQEGVWNAVVILREIQAKGYPGKETILRNYVRPMRPGRKTPATVRFETGPGEQLQNDWGEIWTKIGGERRKVYFAVSTLGYSRRFHFWATDSLDAEHTYESIVLAFEYFGGVTHEVLVDNQRALVINHRIGDRVQFHERFVDLAGHYGFLPRACRPHRPQTKGKDERMVGYVKNHFYQRYREFESFEHMNQLGIVWLAQEADPRFHRAVQEVVGERFQREAPHLAPLPATRYDTSYVERRWASWDGFVDICGNRYSIPDDYRGRAVTVRIRLDGTAAVYSDDVFIIAHRLRPAKEGWVTVPGHHDRLWRETLNVERRDLAVYEEVAQCNS